MARNGDVGPYAVHNVGIVTVSKNLSDAQLRRSRRNKQLRESAIGESSMRDRRFTARHLNVRMPPRLQAALDRACQERECTPSELVRGILRKALEPQQPAPEQPEDAS
jgi:hypothetical protein